MSDSTDPEPLVSALADNDEDGVINSSDLCSSTNPFNASDTVNSNGCSLSQLDTDSDGLSDYDESVDETSLRTAELIPSDGSSYGYFGYATATNGEKLLVGHPYGNSGGVSSGTATVYSWNHSSWEEDILAPSDGATYDNFGTSVSLDDEVALIGARGNDSGTSSGYASVFRYDGTSWNEEATLTPTDGSITDRFGASVSVGGDVSVIGAYLNDEAGTDAGAVYVYRYDGTTWNEETKITASDAGAGDYFGRSVFVSEGMILVGSIRDDDKASNAGAVYVYRFDGTTWSEEAKLIPSDGTFNNYFGFSISMDGSRAVIGAYGNASFVGAAYIFTWDGSSWTQEAKLTASDSGSLNMFGYSVSISGEEILIGSPYDSDSGSYSGSAYLFTWDGSSWAQKEKLIASSGSANDYFGFSVSINNHLALVGSYGRDGVGSNTGSTFVYDFSETELTDPNNPDMDDDGILDGSDENPFDFDGTYYTVTKTADTNDGKCNTDCSLREALALSKTDTTTPFITIEFNIPSTDSGCNATTGVCTLSPAKALPALTRSYTIIDGSTQAGSSNYNIVIDGTSAGSTTSGLIINNSSSSTIEGIRIQNFGSHGIYIKGSASADNEISNCLIGVDESGADQSNGGSGIYTTSGVDTIISGNTIAYNAKKGVQLTTTATIRNIISQNSIHDNVSTGIALATGANNTKASPTMTLAKITGTTVTITGTAISGDTIEVFIASADAEGQTYIGSTTADGTGNWSLTTNTTTAPKDSKVLATATDTTNGTSQFSATKTVK